MLAEGLTDSGTGLRLDVALWKASEPLLSVALLHDFVVENRKRESFDWRRASHQFSALTKMIIGRTFAILLITMAVLSLAASQAPNKTTALPAEEAADQSSRLERQFMKLEGEWMKAVKSRDKISLERILSNEFQLTTSVDRRKKTNKRQFIKDSLSPSNRLQSFGFDKTVVSLMGDKAIVSTLYKEKAQQEGTEQEVNYFLTDIWIKRENSWQVLARHLIDPSTEADRAAKLCAKQCRTDYRAAMKFCVVEKPPSDKDGADSYEYDKTCSANALTVHTSCIAACKK